MVLKDKKEKEKKPIKIGILVQVESETQLVEFCASVWWSGGLEWGLKN